MFKLLRLCETDIKNICRLFYDKKKRFVFHQGLKGPYNLENSSKNESKIYLWIIGSNNN